MRIAVFGAAGKSGQIFIRYAIEQGYSVTANTFHHTISLEHPKLKVVTGDATDIKVVQKTVQGCNVVVSLVGHNKNSVTNMQTLVIKNIIACKPKRLISLTGTGARLDGDIVPLVDRFVTSILLKFDSRRIFDGRDHLAALKNSGLDWTVVRVMKLHDGKARPFTLREHGPSKLLTSRYEVAYAIVDLIESNEFTGKAPIISA